jgi:hypothetical protein
VNGAIAQLSNSEKTQEIPMLWNKDWEKTHIKADPFSLESLIAWVEKQPADTSYNWDSCEDCLVGQYVRAVTGSDSPSGEVIYRELFPDLDTYFAVCAEAPWTFGAALDRARRIAKR